jgi:hypothetical protein
MSWQNLLETPNYIILGSLVAAWVLVSLVHRKVPEATRDAVIIAPGKYDPKNSWISNTTVFAAILGAPIKDLGPASSISSLNVLFLALGGVALLTALATTRAGKDSQNQDINVSGVRPYVWTARIALWAALGQLATLAYMIWAADSQVLGWIAKSIFLASIIAATVVLTIFAWRTITKHLKSATKAPPKTAAGPARASEPKDIFEGREGRLVSLQSEGDMPPEQPRRAHVDMYSAAL